MTDAGSSDVSGSDPAGIPEYLEDHEASQGPLGGVVRLARMMGSSICSRDAAPWVTDFLNAAYYRRAAGEREVDDLRFAFSVLTSFWYHRPGRPRLHILDLVAFNRAYGGHRLDDRAGSNLGTLSRAQLQSGADALIGEWFTEAYGDDDRRGWGIAFPTAEDKAAYDHSSRMALAMLGKLTPEQAPVEEQLWHTYPPVEMPSAEGVIAALTKPETWPDFSSEIGRFTPLRPGGLDGQTFEIEVAAGTGIGLPIFMRGYVTITRLVTPEDPDSLRAYFDELERGMREYGDGEQKIFPEGAEPLVGLDLTTHEGHFMGSGHNRLVLYADDGRALMRAAGTWDPMPWHLDQTYRIAGREAQHAFWGQGHLPEQSMLHQIALKVAARS